MKDLSAPRRGGVSVAQRTYGLLLLTAAILSINASAAVINWTNLNGGLWSAATNWSPNTVPAAADYVIIAAPVTYSVAQDLHVTITSLTLGSVQCGSEAFGSCFSHPLKQFRMASIICALVARQASVERHSESSIGSIWCAALFNHRFLVAEEITPRR